ncbi:hypothetical protein F3J44_15050 [Pantoea sp. Tr-811]|uniref:hypothetical protein n=1 Tax=Pantoea sp. Tr-811 TaxID=2608361 RepID=UPI0014223E6B|nr:hypothetical protein [Pantoea sp. Tr-811]NIF27686.1 hypothetical protein [Pantoea sp. Tr-811]
MQDENYSGEEAGPAIELPPGVFPPMPGYTHKDLLAVADARIARLLSAQGVDPGLIRETLIALSSHLNADFENEGIQYLISTCHQQPADDPTLHDNNIRHVAEKVGVIALNAAADSLGGSPLLELGKGFYETFMYQAGEAVRDHVLTLNQA